MAASPSAVATSVRGHGKTSRRRLLRAAVSVQHCGSNAGRVRLLARAVRNQAQGESLMAEGVYRIVDVVGVSEKSWEDAGRKAVETAAGSLRDLRVAEVVKLDMKVENGKVAAFRTRVALSFKYEP